MGWILSTMTALEPGATYRETYPTTAQAIADAAEANPLPREGAAKTAAILVALAWFESRFQVNAQGDCPKRTSFGTCEKGSTPQSFGAWQVSRSNLAGLDLSPESVLEDAGVAARASLTLVRESFRVCAREPLSSRLGWYAGGTGRCISSEDAKRKSEHRMAKAVWIYDHFAQKPKGTSSSFMTDHIMQFFAYDHLPPHLQKVSAPFGELAKSMVAEGTGLPRNPERIVALRKLLEAKDAAVRSFLAKGAWNMDGT